MTVTGPNGEAFPLNLSYHAGIGVDQEASWVGLGWDLNTGEISRNINGVPDDWNNVGVAHEEYNWNTGSFETLNSSRRFFGPVYFDQVTFPANDATSFNSIFDTYRTDYGQTRIPVPFEFPDYDYYMASAPGLSGKLNMALLQYKSLIRQNSSSYKYYPYQGDCTSPPDPCYNQDVLFDDADEFDAKPQFWFAGDHYVNAHVAPYDLSSVSLFWQNWGVPSDASTYSSGDFSSTINLAPKGGYHIEYFTNSQINTFEPDPQVASSNDLRDNHKFLDYCIPSGSPRRNSTYFNADHIGAIHITDPNGMMYHFSLPVHTLYEATNRFEIETYDEDNNIDNASDLDNGAADLNEDKIVHHRREADYVHTWKLTAITGPDYVDVNHNGIADDGDSGYWIALSYTKWTNGTYFVSRHPYYGFNVDYRYEETPVSSAETEVGRERFYPEGTSQTTQKEIYYLDKVETATQVAFFVKEIRMDACGVNAIGKLRLNRVVLMDRSDAGLFNSTASATITPFSNPTDTTARQTCNYQQYLQDQQDLEDNALQQVVFEYDYSLAPKAYDNANSNYGASAIAIGGKTLFYAITSNSSVSVNTGKLTLKKLRLFGEGYEQVAPAYEFSYDGNPNPEYDHVKKDMFGFYKSTNSSKTATADVQRGLYMTTASKDDQDAWSLSQIKTPSGKLIKPEYESDEYAHVMAESGGNYEDPVRIFRLEELLDPKNNVNQPSFFLDSDDFDDLWNTQYNDITYKLASFDYVCSGPWNGEIDNTISSITDLNYDNSYTFNLNSADACTTSTFTYDAASRIGYVKLSMKKVYGGGIRTKSIAIQNSFHTAESYKAEFTYEDGVVGHDPSPYHLSPKEGNGPQLLTKSLMADNRHVGPARVGYSKMEATTRDLESQTMGKVVYEFNNYAHKFRPSLEEDYIYTWSPLPNVYKSNYWALIAITQSDAMYGKLKKQSIYDRENKLVSSEERFYTLPAGRGRVEETFNLSFKNAGLGGTEDGIVRFRIMCSRTSFSPWLSKKIEYKNGVYTTTYLDDVHISGSPQKMRIEEGTDHFEVTTAFQQDVETPAMGSKHVSLGKTNQLSAVFTRESEVNDAGHRTVTGHLDDSFPTRKNSNGAFVTASETGLYRAIKGDITQNSDTKTMQDIQLRDDAHNVLGWKDAQGKEFAARLDLSGRNLQIALIENSNHASFTYSGFEHTKTYGVSGGGSRSYADGEVELLTGSTVMTGITGVAPHTGEYMLRLVSTGAGARFRAVEDNQVVSGETVMKGLRTGKTYHVSVWMHEDSPSTATLSAVLNGSDGTNPINVSVSKTISNYTVEAGDWKLVSLEITVPANYQSSGGTNNDLRIILKNTSGTAAYFDDLKVYPVDASLVTQVNDDRWRRPLVESVNDGLYTRAEYDPAGRIRNIYTEYPDVSVGEKRIENHEYGFKREIN